MGLKCDHRYPYMREVDGDLAEGYTAMKAERFEDAVLRLALKVKERALSQGVQPRKEEVHPSQSLQRKHCPASAVFGSIKTTSSFDVQNCKIMNWCRFKPLNLW